MREFGASTFCRRAIALVKKPVPSAPFESQKVILNCRPAFIESSAKEIFDKLKTDRPSIGNKRERFVDIAAQLHNDLNAVHGFREFNGRSQRVFLDHLAHEHGFFVDWPRSSRETLTAASVLGMAGLNAPMRGLLHAITAATTQNERTTERKRHLAPAGPSVEAPRQARRIR